MSVAQRHGVTHPIRGENSLLEGHANFSAIQPGENVDSNRSLFRHIEDPKRLIRFDPPTLDKQSIVIRRQEVSFHPCAGVG
jgi:hypothetical protein